MFISWRDYHINVHKLDYVEIEAYGNKPEVFVLLVFSGGDEPIKHNFHGSTAIRDCKDAYRDLISKINQCYHHNTHDEQ